MTVQDCICVMGMPVTVRVVDPAATQADLAEVYVFMRRMDRIFSAYRADSETERINRGELAESRSSQEMQEVLAMCETARLETGGYFDARYGGKLDPSGAAKGYAIAGAGRLLRERGFADFFVDAGGDIQTSGVSSRREKWRVGIQSPFATDKLISTAYLSGEGVATSGSYARGPHIYDPVAGRAATGLAGVTVVAADVCQADLYATAAFAMGEKSILFLESQPGIEGLMVCGNGDLYCTTGFPRFLKP